MGQWGNGAMGQWGSGAVSLRSASVAAAVVMIAVASLLSGCGRKGDPLPPQIRRAETTRDLEVFQQATDAVVTWTYPSMTSAGGPLPDLESIEVWRADIPLGHPNDRGLRRGLLAATCGTEENHQREKDPEFRIPNSELPPTIPREVAGARTRNPKFEIRHS